MVLCESNDTRSYSALVAERIDVHFSSQRGSLNGLDLEFNIFYLLAGDKSNVVEGSVCAQVIRQSRGKLQLMA